MVASIGWPVSLPRWRQRYLQAQGRARDRRLLQTARRLRPDLALFLRGDACSADVLTELKRLIRGPLVTWWVDDPWRFPGCAERLALYDHVFIFDRFYLPRLEAAGVARAHFLPCACDETVYRPMALRDSERRRWASDVAFVAWGYPEREVVVRALADEVDVGVWGGGGSGLRAQRTATGTNVLRGPAVSSQTAAKIYNASKMGLNIHAIQTRIGGVNTRTFELLACGRFQLVDRVAGVEELLEPDAEIVCYRSPEEARALARRYLADPVTRNRIAAKGRERVLAEHTYVCRMRTLLALAGAAP